MKRNIFRSLLAAFMITSIASSVNAQFRYGINAGVSIAKPDLSGTVGTGTVIESGAGFRGGLTLEYQVPTLGLAFDASVDYLRYNLRLANERGASDYTDIGRNFIEVPLNIKYKFWLGNFHNLVAPMVMTGPSFMFNLDKQPENAPLTQKRFQPGWNVGLGFDIINFIQLNAGYRFAFGNAIKHSDLMGSAKLRNKGWYVSATLLFDF
jgi:hypothetical protein